jgi:hypothetical protein
MPTLTLPPDIIIGRPFPNVFVIPPNRIFDPGNNVLMVANLFNFAIDGDQPRDDHRQFLANTTAPLLAASPSAGARLLGLASRSGSDEHNLLLSARRARNVDTALAFFLALIGLADPPNVPPRTSVGAQGEQFAANLGVKDGTESARFRSVLVTVVADRTLNTPIRLLP